MACHSEAKDKNVRTPKAASVHYFPTKFFITKGCDLQIMQNNITIEATFTLMK